MARQRYGLCFAPPAEAVGVNVCILCVCSARAVWDVCLLCVRWKKICVCRVLLCVCQSMLSVLCGLSVCLCVCVLFAPVEGSIEGVLQTPP